MVNTSDPVTSLALMTLFAVVMGTLLLVAVAFFRRWQQIRYARHAHALHRQYRPVLAKVLSGARGPCAIEGLRELSLPNLELLLDPLFSRRKLRERQLVFLQALCSELGLIALWQRRTANGHARAGDAPSALKPPDSSDRAAIRHLLRAKSIRNLGKLRHRPSWPLLVTALDDRHRDIQWVALRSLGAIRAPESFPALRERLHAAVREGRHSPPLPGLQAAMVSFDLSCAHELLPLLRQSDSQVRRHAMEILRNMVYRKATGQHRLTLTKQLLTPPMVNLLVERLAVDPSAEIRSRAAEVIVFLGDERAVSVLQHLLLDRQWYVRMRAARALAQLHPTSEPIHLALRQCLLDPHWRVRETAINTLIALGQEGKNQLFRHFLTSENEVTRHQIVEVIEGTGLMSALVEEYSSGARGVDALMVEHLASDIAPLGLSGVLRTLNPEARKRFLDRFLPYAEAKMRFMKETQTELETHARLQPALQFPPQLAA